MTKEEFTKMKQELEAYVHSFLYLQLQIFLEVSGTLTYLPMTAEYLACIKIMEDLTLKFENYLKWSEKITSF